jgi:RNA methyltransferase, TrmH family
MRRREGESKVYGVHACRAVFTRRPDDVLKAFLTEERSRGFGELLASLARGKRPYRVVPDEDLEKLTESRHHEGICLVVRTAPTAQLEDLLGAQGPVVLLGLVDVGNPHNVGAILRTAAHFGVRGVLMPGEGGRLPAAALRTAQGGSEWLDVVHEPFLGPLLAAARKAGFAVAATSSRGGRDVLGEPLPARMLVLLGSEDQGLPEDVVAQADAVLSVPGTGHVESLNVGAATAVLLAEYWRQHRRPARGGGPGPRRKR